MDEQKQAVEMHNAMIEMYQAGFVDCWKLSKNLKSEQDWIDLNNAWRKVFSKRFNRTIKEELKNGEHKGRTKKSK